jgi:hypothetical protein
MAIETEVTLVCDDDDDDTLTACLEDGRVYLIANNYSGGSISLFVKPSDARQFAHHLLALADKAEFGF